MIAILPKQEALEIGKVLWTNDNELYLVTTGLTNDFLRLVSFKTAKIDTEAYCDLDGVSNISPQLETILLKTKKFLKLSNLSFRFKWNDSTIQRLKVGSIIASPNEKKLYWLYIENNALKIESLSNRPDDKRVFGFSAEGKLEEVLSAFEQETGQKITNCLVLDSSEVEVSISVEE
jgi:hypothetical protein